MTNEYRYCRKSIRDAIKKCITKPNYYVGICHSYRNTAEHDLKEEVITEDFINEIICVRRFEIKFKNGSIISIIPANDCARGKRIHELIVDGAIDDTIKDSVLRPRLIKYER